MFLSLEQLFFLNIKKEKFHPWKACNSLSFTACQINQSTSAVRMKMFLESDSKVKSLDENSHPVELLAPL